MSQIYARATSAEPAIPTSFITDDGTAIPVANELEIKARDTSENNDNGIQTVADPNNGKTVYVELTNRQTTLTTTTDASETNLSVFALGATPGVYFFWGNVQCFNTTDSLGSGYGFEAAIRTDGAAATEISIEVTNNFEEVGMEDVYIEVTKNVNSFVLNGFGLAGKTIKWNTVFEYRFVS